MKPIQVKAIEQEFHLLLFIMLYYVIIVLQSMDEHLMCDHSHESYWALLSLFVMTHL